jgi:hypothetical protein
VRSVRDKSITSWQEMVGFAEHDFITCGNVVESAERNPIVKPEEKYLKQLQSESIDLDTLVCGEDLFRHFRIRLGNTAQNA